MLLGRRDSFAIEYEIDPVEIEGWLFGRVAFWACRQRIGNFEHGSSLRALIPALRELAQRPGIRTSAELFALPRNEAIARVDAALFLDDGRSDQQVEADWRNYFRFLALPYQYEAFDGWRAILIENGEFARFIWRGPDRVIVNECRLEIGEFEEVVSRTAAQLARGSPSTS